MLTHKYKINIIIYLITYSIEIMCMSVCMYSTCMLGAIGG